MKDAPTLTKSIRGLVEMSSFCERTFDIYPDIKYRRRISELKGIWQGCGMYHVRAHVTL
jgi:hypothetical protein